MPRNARRSSSRDGRPGAPPTATTPAELTNVAAGRNREAPEEPAAEEEPAGGDEGPAEGHLAGTGWRRITGSRNGQGAQQQEQRAGGDEAAEQGRQAVDQAGGRAAGRGQRPGEPEERGAGESEDPPAQSEHAHHRGEDDQADRDPGQEQRLVIGAEVAHRPLLHRGRGGVDDDAADADDRDPPAGTTSAANSSPVAIPAPAARTPDRAARIFTRIRPSA